MVTSRGVFPSSSRQAVEQGHEIASHGFYHRLAFEQTSDDFYQDVLSARKLLEDISGQAVLGHRAAAFSELKRPDVALHLPPMV